MSPVTLDMSILTTAIHHLSPLDICDTIKNDKSFTICLHRSDIAGPIFTQHPYASILCLIRLWGLSKWSNAVYKELGLCCGKIYTLVIQVSCTKTNGLSSFCQISVHVVWPWWLSICLMPKVYCFKPRNSKSAGSASHASQLEDEIISVRYQKQRSKISKMI